MKTGDVVYFKTAKQDSKRKTPLAQFKGLGFGVFLGHLPLGGKEPNGIIILRLLASIGMIKIDDIVEFLGEESGEKCITMFENKYYGEPTDDTVQEPEEPSPTILDPTGKPATTGLVDASGAPLAGDVQ